MTVRTINVQANYGFNSDELLDGHLNVGDGVEFRNSDVEALILEGGALLTATREFRGTPRPVAEASRIIADFAGPLSQLIGDTIPPYSFEYIHIEDAEEWGDE